jgi:hypothetical protein
MARILRQVTVARDGWHNGFTDLAYWQGAYWVSYRKGSAHASIDGEAVLSVSLDRARFREAARLKMPGDNRDPKLVPLRDDRLAMIFPSWLGGYEKRDLQQYISFSNDGFRWEPPTPILARGQWLWRVRRRRSVFYGLIERICRPDEKTRMCLELVTSDNLLDWTMLARVGENLPLNESDIFFHPDGEAWIVARGFGQPGYSYFAAARPPYTHWRVRNLKTLIHAPVILAHKGVLYVAGRRDADLEQDATFPFLARRSLGIWTLTRGKVEPVLRIPATCDCSYPGLIKDPQGRICLSYYSQHAYDTGVIEKPFRPEPAPPHDKGQLLTPDDVYFAELELP